MQTMQVLRSIMADPHFTLRTAAFTNGKFLDERYVHHCAVQLGVDMFKAYGFMTVLLPNHVVALMFIDRLGEGYITVSRHFGLAVNEDDSVTQLNQQGNGYVALHEGTHEAVTALLAGASEGVSDQPQTEDRPLLH